MNQPSQFDSTVAMTLYNLLCKRPCMTAVELHEVASTVQHFDLELGQVDRALAGLVTRKWVNQVSGRYGVIDSQRRLVIGRDSGPDQVELGMRRGGWAGWTVKGAQQGNTFERIPIEVASRVESGSP